MSLNDSSTCVYEHSSYVRDVTAPNYMIFMPLCAALIAGTGGAYAASNVQIADGFAANAMVTILEPRENRDTTPTFSVQITRIRDVFGLTMSDLASILGVSRPTAYAWVNGSEPRAEYIDKLWMLSSWADDFEQLGISRITSYLRRPLVKGQSLLDLLASGEQLQQAVVELKHVANADLASERAMKNLPRSSQNSRSVLDLSPVITDLG